MGAVVAPGESVCNTDVGAPVSYVVQESDAGSVIHNNAVVTVQTQEDEPREFQQTAQTEVAGPGGPWPAGAVLSRRGQRELSRGTRIRSKSVVDDHRGHSNDIVPPLPPEIRDGYNWYGESSEDFVEGGCEGTSPQPETADANANRAAPA